MDTLINSATKTIGRRWFLTALLPVLLLSAVSIIVYMDAIAGWQQSANWWETLPADQQLAATTLGLGIVVILSFMLDALGLILLQWAEGYWSGFWLGKYRERRQNYYRDIAQKSRIRFSELISKEKEGVELTTSELAEKQVLDEVLHYYPSSLFEMPTQLGNILRSAEDYPRVRYGLDPLVTWKHLSPYLNDTLQSTLADSRAVLDLAIRLVYLSIVFTAVAAFLEGTHFGIAWAVILLLGGGLVSFVSYQWALQAARVYSDLQRTAFDLHRFDLYEALHIEPPRESGEVEREAGRRLTQFLWRGDLMIHYQHGRDHDKAVQDGTK